MKSDISETMKDIILFFAGIIIMGVCACGCTTKTRSIDLDGMYVSEAGTLAVGSIEVMAAPVGEETAAIRYAEDTAWLSPSTKTHEIKIMLTGTNSVKSAEGIVKDICGAFVSVGGKNAATQDHEGGGVADAAARNHEGVE